MIENENPAAGADQFGSPGSADENNSLYGVPVLKTETIEEAKVVTMPATEVAEAARPKIIIYKHQLVALMEKIKDYEAKEEKIAEVIKEAMMAFGLLDKRTGEPSAELKNGNVMTAIINGVKENISVSDLIFNRKKAEAELMHTFGFLSKLMPIFEDYARKQ